MQSFVAMKAKVSPPQPFLVHHSDVPSTSTGTTLSGSSGSVSPSSASATLPNTQTPTTSAGGNSIFSSSATATSASGGKIINVAVVGLSGTEKEKGTVGVGKSAICNRFVRPLQDDYFTDHISTLSQVDFGSRVINNDHWLYWGERTVITDDGADLSFRIVEQTEFVDDESFQTLKSSTKENYLKRATTLKLYSPDKLMYICKNQLALEHEYEQRILFDGRIVVDGFVCVFDVSQCPTRSVEQQADFVVHLLASIIKLKKPVVLVTTKHDDADARLLKEVEKLLARKELKGQHIPHVETSANLNVNADLGFILLAQLLDKNRPKIRPISFEEAAKSRREIVEVARLAVVQKLRQVVTDHRLPWSQISRQLSGDSDFAHFCELCGQSQAKDLFRTQQNELREKYTKRKLREYLERLPDILPDLLPDASFVQGKNWDQMVTFLLTLPAFSRYFLPPGTLAATIDCWPSEIGHPEDNRIPAEVLYTAEAEHCFQQHVGQLEAQERKTALQEEFLAMLQASTQVTPGKPLEDVRIFFLGKDCFESLSESDVQALYDSHQRGLVKRARKEFQELLLENVEEFVSRVLFSDKPTSGKQSMPGLDDADIAEIYEKLQEDIRYRQMSRLHKQRDNMISQYVGFISYPLRQHCPAQSKCADHTVENIFCTRPRLTQMQRPAAGWTNPSTGFNCVQSNSSKDQSKPNLATQPCWQNSSKSSPRSAADSLLNILVLGGDGLAEVLTREIQVCFVNNQIQSGGETFTLNCRPLNGDSNSPQSIEAALNSPDFTPAGIVCIFSSRTSFDALRKTLLRVLLPTLSSSWNDSCSFPLVLLLASDQTHLEDLPYLQQQGLGLAESLQCPFIGISQDDADNFNVRNAASSRHRGLMHLVSEQQVRRCLDALLLRIRSQRIFATPSRSLESESLLHGQQRKLSPGSQNAPCTESSQPDVRILICLMCGDDYSPQLVLNPLLNHYSTTFVENSSGASPSNLNAAEHNGFDRHGQHQQQPPVISSETGGQRTLILETFLPSTGHKLKAAVTVTAYHTAFIWIAESIYYTGYVLVYSTKRKASLAQLDSLAHMIPEPIPILMMAVGEVAEFFSDRSTQNLMTEGNDIADRIGARFITISKATEQQIGIYTPFLEETWLRKREIAEAGYLGDFSDEGSSRPSTENSPRVFRSSNAYLNAVPNQQQTAGTRNRTTSEYDCLNQCQSGWQAENAIGELEQSPPTYRSSRENIKQLQKQKENRLSIENLMNDINDWQQQHVRLKQEGDTESMVEETCDGTELIEQKKTQPPIPAKRTVLPFSHETATVKESGASTASDSAILQRPGHHVAAASYSASSPLPSEVTAAETADAVVKLRQHVEVATSDCTASPLRKTIGAESGSDDCILYRHDYELSKRQTEAVDLREEEENETKHLRRVMFVDHSSHGYCGIPSCSTVKRASVSAATSTSTSASCSLRHRCVSDLHLAPSSSKHQNRNDRRNHSFAPSTSMSASSGCFHTSTRRLSALKSMLLGFLGSSKHIAGNGSSARAATFFDASSSSANAAQRVENPYSPEKSKPGKLNLQNFSNVSDVVHKITPRDRSKTGGSQLQISVATEGSTETTSVASKTSPAPLATPENIEIGPDAVSYNQQAPLGQRRGKAAEIIIIEPQREKEKEPSRMAGMGRKPTPHKRTRRKDIPSVKDRIQELNRTLQQKSGTTSNCLNTPPQPSPPPTGQSGGPFRSRLFSAREKETPREVIQPEAFWHKPKKSFRSVSSDSLDFLQQRPMQNGNSPEGAFVYSNNSNIVRAAAPLKAGKTHRYTKNKQIVPTSIPLSNHVSPSKHSELSPTQLASSNAGIRSPSAFMHKVTGSFRFGKFSHHLNGSKSVPQSPCLSSRPLPIGDNAADENGLASPTPKSNGWSNGGMTLKTTSSPVTSPPLRAVHLSRGRTVAISPPFCVSPPSSSSTGGRDSSFEPDESGSPRDWLGAALHSSGGGYFSKSPRKEDKAKEKDLRKVSRETKKSLSEKSSGLLAPSKQRKKSSKELGDGAGGNPKSLHEHSKNAPFGLVPLFVRKCVEFVETEGLTTEGIYRVPGNQVHVATLEQKFAEDPNISFRDLDIPVNAVATALKNFFATLSEPVIPGSVYEDLMQAMSCSDKTIRLKEIRGILRTLPPENIEVLKYFLIHLRKPHFDTFETMAQMTQKLEEFLQLLLDQYEYMFLNGELQVTTNSVPTTKIVKRP